MDYQAFMSHLQEYSDIDEIVSNKLNSSQIISLAQRISGFATSIQLTLLNIAVNYLESNEIYCEVGCYQGLSLIAALHNYPDVMAIAVDSFADLNPQKNNLGKLINNLEQFQLIDRVIICDQTFECFFAELATIEISDRIGIYFYDAVQDYRSVLLALLLVRPFLADRALIIVNGTNYIHAQQAIKDFLTVSSHAELLLNFDQLLHPTYSFLDGMILLGWNFNQNSQLQGETQPLQQSIEVFQELSLPFVSFRNQELEKLYIQAVSLHNSQHLVEAEKHYLNFLQWVHDSFQGWLFLGKLYLQQQRFEQALDTFLTALDLDRSQAQLHLNLGITLEALGDYERAIVAYEEALDLEPNLLEALMGQAKLFMILGETTKAINNFQQVIDLEPQNFAVYLELGDAWLAKVEIEAAIAAYQQALTLQPDSLIATNKLKEAFTLKDEASCLHRQAAAMAFKNGKYTEAIFHWHSLLAKEPGHPIVSNQLATCYMNSNQGNKAIEILKDSLELYPDNLENCLYLTFILQDLGETEEAIIVSKEFSRAFPDCLPLYIQYQLLVPPLYKQLGEKEKYRYRFSRGLNNILLHCRSVSSIKDNQQLMQRVQPNLSLAVIARNMFYFSYQGDSDRSLILKYGEIVQFLCQLEYQSIDKSFISERNLSEKIRIGYIAPGMAQLFLGWLRHHDREQFEIYCYVLSNDTAKTFTPFHEYTDHLFCSDTTDVKAVQAKILADKLHILVFPAIGMELHILQLASMQLAPIQCTSWCHPFSTGLTTIQYFISSQLMEPPNAQNHYTEELICLPNIGIAYSLPKVPSLNKSRSDFGICEQKFIYLSCQNLMKYSPEHDYVFVEIARRVPECQFVFISNKFDQITNQFRDRLHGCFTRHNLDANEYCLILSRLQEQDYLQVNLLADVFLDTFTWSGGITALKAIACNLPIVTCPGETMRSRHSYGILKMLGVAETIASTPATYIEIAVNLYLNPEFRKNIISRMQQQLNYLYDDTSCVIALENFYKNVVDSL